MEEDVTTIQEKMQPSQSNHHPNLSRTTRSSGIPYHQEQVVILQKAHKINGGQGMSQSHSDQVIDLAMIDEHIIQM